MQYNHLDTKVVYFNRLCIYFGKIAIGQIDK